MTLPAFMFRPWFVAVASLASILGFIGVLLSVYLYFAGLTYRDLTLYLDPATVEIVKADQSSKLAVTYNGQPVQGAVTAAQVVLWNAGKLPIKRDEVL